MNNLRNLCRKVCKGYVRKWTWLSQKRVVQTTGIDANEKVTITHPFHPKYNREYTLKAHGIKGTRPYLLCIDNDGIEAYIPVEYTNLGHPRLSDEQREDLPYFAYKDLVELKKIIDSL